MCAGQHLHLRGFRRTVGRRVEGLDETSRPHDGRRAARDDQRTVRLSPITIVPGASALCNEATTSSGARDASVSSRLGSGAVASSG